MNTYIHPTLINNARALKTLERRTRSQAFVRSNKLVQLMPTPDKETALLFSAFDRALKQDTPAITNQGHNATFFNDDGPSAA